jgi:hypothetical protein
VANSSEHCNKFSGLIKDGKFKEQLSVISVSQRLCSTDFLVIPRENTKRISTEQIY